MATVFRSRRRYGVAVKFNDHPPSHVHAFGKGCEARFKLNCPKGPVALWDHDGHWTLIHLNELGFEIAERLNECCKTWADVHG